MKDENIKLCHVLESSCLIIIIIMRKQYNITCEYMLPLI